MSKKAITERKRLAAIFASFTILLVGALSLLQSMSLDYYSVANTLKKIIPAAMIMGAIGWVMGMILDKPRTRRAGSLNAVFLNELMRKDEAEEAPASMEVEET